MANARRRAALPAWLECHCEARADIISATNSNTIHTPDVGPASLYPSTITLSNVSGRITLVTVQLNGIVQMFADDYDILLVGPQGQKTILMSDCGGSGSYVNANMIEFDDASPPLPDETPFSLPGSYHPTNYSTGNDPLDTFPPLPAQAYSASLAVFNDTDPNGTWSLYVVDDAIGHGSSQINGWTLRVATTTYSNSNQIIVPSVGNANPYPSQINVVGLQGHIRKVRATLKGISHTLPDDLDILLVGPQGQRTILMSDCGGSDPLIAVNLTFDDLGTPLPDSTLITPGLYHPTNRTSLGDPNDTFPPAPPQVYSAALDVFNNTDPNGIWSLFVVDDAAGDSGGINGG